MEQYSKIDLLIVMSHLGPGGAQKVAATLANRWVERGYKVGFLLNISDINETVTLHKNVSRFNSNYKKFAINIFKITSIYNLIRSCLILRKTVLNNKPKYIISFICPTNVKTIIACAGIKESKLIISERNNLLLQKFPSYIEIGRKLLYRFADVVTANSIGTAVDLESLVPKNKIYYIPNPVEIPEINIDKKRYKNKNNLKLLYAGRLVAQKRIEIILQSTNQLLKKGYSVSLTIAGDGPLMGEIKDYCKRNKIEEYVNIVGYVDDIDKYHMESDVFILCSDYEGTSNALLEAMSYGLTCIVSHDANVSSDVIRHQQNGIVLEKNNHEELEKILIQLFENTDLLYEYGLAARKSCEKYDVDSVFAEWDRLLA